MKIADMDQLLENSQRRGLLGFQEERWTIASTGMGKGAAPRSILDLYILLVAAAETKIFYESRKLCELTVFRHAVST